MIVKLIETAYRLLWGDLFTIPFGNSSIGISLMILLLVPAGIREFDSSFFGVLMQILYLSHLRLIFLSNFVIFIVLLCTLCGIIKKTDFIIGEKRYVYIYHWK